MVLSDRDTREHHRHGTLRQPAALEYQEGISLAHKRERFWGPVARIFPPFYREIDFMERDLTRFVFVTAETDRIGGIGHSCSGVWLLRADIHVRFGEMSLFARATNIGAKPPVAVAEL
jgi:hypothetical protein